MFRVCTIVGTRPELIKLSSFIKKADKVFLHSLVHTGQNYDYELNEIFFEDLNIRKPDHILNCAKNSVNKTISEIFLKVDKILELIKPDAVIILGDTNSGLAAIAAKKKHIPVFHLEAGNRSYDYKVPEELNRKLIDHCSDINFTYTNHAKNYLVSEGISPDRVIKVGSPMLEVIKQNEKKIKRSNILRKLKLKKKNYFLISFHREENVDNKENITKFFEFLFWLNKKFKKKIVISTHYRTKKKITSQINSLKIKNKTDIYFLKPFNFSDYICLQKNCDFIFSDSGTLTEESSILTTKAIMLRESHERPEGMEEASTIMCGLNIKKIETAMKILNNENYHEIVKEYKINNFTDKVIKNIISYIDYKINKKI